MKKYGLMILALLLIITLLGCSAEVASPPVETPSPDSLAETVAEPQTETLPDIPVDYTVEITEELIDGIIGATYKKPKNVILMIGDGMGPNDIIISETYSGEAYPFGFVMNKLEHHGFAETVSANSSVTDSAASGTALATGFKTNNGYIGLLPDETVVKNLSELARESGKLVGIVTDDNIYGATPSSFVTHCISRDEYGQLTDGILKFAPDVLIGSDYDSVKQMLTADGSAVLKNGYVIAESTRLFDEKAALCVEGGKKFAGFNGGCRKVASDHLAVSTKAALELLKNDNGFFLMIEGCGTDVYGHGNDIQGKMSSVANLDKAVAAVLLFMKNNPDTLLVITSDHETGGVKLPDSADQVTNALFTRTSHSSTNVRVFALGQGSEYFNGKTVDNTDIAKFLQNAING